MLVSLYIGNFCVVLGLPLCICCPCLLGASLVAKPAMPGGPGKLVGSPDGSSPGPDGGGGGFPGGPPGGPPHGPPGAPPGGPSGGGAPLDLAGSGPGGKLVMEDLKPYLPDWALSAFTSAPAGQADELINLSET